MTTLMFAPSGRTGVVMASRSQTNYTIAADGTINAAAVDIVDLLNAGFTLANRTSSSANGLSAQRLNIIGFKNADGTTLAAAASSGKFGLSQTAGTSEALVGEAAQSNTKTDTALTEFSLPPNYVAGQNVTVTVNAKIAGSGTAGTKTLGVTAYESSQAGAEGANICATAAQNMTTTSADYAFTLTGTDLSPGDVVVLAIVTALQETGGSTTVNSQINSVRFG